MHSDPEPREAERGQNAREGVPEQVVEGPPPPEPAPPPEPGWVSVREKLQCVVPYDTKRLPLESIPWVGKDNQGVLRLHVRRVDAPYTGFG
jgi:hypothetical protein